jgi:hypothetical protein
VERHGARSAEGSYLPKVTMTGRWSEASFQLSGSPT